MNVFEYSSSLSDAVSHIDPTEMKPLPPGWLQELYVYRQSPEVVESLFLETGSWAFNLFIRQPVASGLQLVWGGAGAGTGSQVAHVGLDVARGDFEHHLSCLHFPSAETRCALSAVVQSCAGARTWSALCMRRA